MPFDYQRIKPVPNVIKFAEIVSGVMEQKFVDSRPRSHPYVNGTFSAYVLDHMLAESIGFEDENYGWGEKEATELATTLCENEDLKEHRGEYWFDGIIKPMNWGMDKNGNSTLPADKPQRTNALPDDETTLAGYPYNFF